MANATKEYGGWLLVGHRGIALTHPQLDALLERTRHLLGYFTLWHVQIGMLTAGSDPDAELVPWRLRSICVGVVQIVSSCLGLAVALVFRGRDQAILVVWLIGAGAFLVLAGAGSALAWRKLKRDLIRKAIPMDAGKLDEWQGAWRLQVWRAARFQVPFVLVMAVLVPAVAGFPLGTGTVLVIMTCVLWQFEHRHGCESWLAAKDSSAQRLG